MPKEVIAAKMPKRDLIVGWTKGQRGSLGVDLHNNFLFLSDQDESDTDDCSIYSALYFKFDSRESVNRLIRVLRQMRDDVYGKDA